MSDSYRKRDRSPEYSRHHSSSSSSSSSHGRPSDRDRDRDHGRDRDRERDRGREYESSRAAVDGKRSRYEDERDSSRDRYSSSSSSRGSGSGSGSHHHSTYPSPSSSSSHSSTPHNHSHPSHSYSQHDRSSSSRRSPSPHTSSSSSRPYSRIGYDSSRSGSSGVSNRDHERRSTPDTKALELEAQKKKEQAEAAAAAAAAEEIRRKKQKEEEELEAMYEDEDEEAREQRLIEERRRKRREMEQALAKQKAAAAAAAQPPPVLATPARVSSPATLSASAASPAMSSSSSSSRTGSPARLQKSSSPPNVFSFEDDDDDTAQEVDLSLPDMPALLHVEHQLMDEKPAEKDVEDRGYNMNMKQLEQEIHKKLMEKDETKPQIKAEVKKEEVEVESEDDGEFDMFSDSPTNLVKAKALRSTAKAGAGENLGLRDNWDDSDGYYNFQTGDIINGKYRVFSSFGRGQYSTVLRAVDIECPQTRPPPSNVAEVTLEGEVAIKVIRSNDYMHIAGKKEIEILNRICQEDPKSKRHCIRLLSHFEFRGHLCMVFSPGLCNLRDLLKRYGSSKGLKIDAVRLYAKQLFIALHHLRKLSIIHADLKPDNIVVNDRKNVLSVVDFGCAFYAADAEVTPLLQSRFYRAPEVMLGLMYDCSVDMWSAAVTLYELYTGRILFNGRDNNDMLMKIQEVRGRIPKKMLTSKAMFKSEHVDDEGNFIFRDTDPVTKREVLRRVPLSNYRPEKELGAMLQSAMVEKTAEERRKVNLFKDLLEKCLAIDPASRLSPDDALLHPFISDNLGGAASGSAPSASK